MAEFSSNKPYFIRALYQWISDNQGTPHLIVNAEFPNVEVPTEHIRDGEIVLNISSSAVQSLDLGNQWISFSARFSGVARTVRVPVGAVRALVARENAQGMAFVDEAVIAEDELEMDAVEEVEKQQFNDLKPVEGKKQNKKKPNLKIVK